jgi:DNA polymerase I-like protein with 3'-5' exonuclease and polymerase domains
MHITFQLKNYLPELNKTETIKLLKIEIPLVKVLADMEKEEFD